MKDPSCGHLKGSYPKQLLRERSFTYLTAVYMVTRREISEAKLLREITDVELLRFSFFFSFFSFVVYLLLFGFSKHMCHNFHMLLRRAHRTFLNGKTERNATRGAKNNADLHSLTQATFVR